MIEERRYKLLRIRRHDLETIIRWFLFPTTHVWKMASMVDPPIPDDTKVARVIYSCDRDCIGVYLWHESFDIVEEGTEPPWVFGDMSLCAFACDEYGKQVTSDES